MSRLLSLIASLSRHVPLWALVTEIDAYHANPEAVAVLRYFAPVEQKTLSTTERK